MAYNKLYNENILHRESNIKLSLDTSWLSGFIDAEGSFSARLKDDKTTKSGKTVLTDFTIAQKDPTILHDIKSLLVLNSGTKKYVTYDKSWNGWRFSLSNKNLLIKLIDYLNAHPLITIKLTDYLIWVEVHTFCMNKLHLLPEGISKVSEIIDKMVSEKFR